jgi:4-hydroxy-4-methyl-2-oxoglutarate aldolase
LTPVVIPELLIPPFTGNSAMISLTDRLEACYTGVIHDVMREMGLRDFTLPPEIRPIMPEHRLCGPAFTIEGKVDVEAEPHATLLAWTGLLSAAPAGAIWTSQPHDREVAHMGELSAETLKNKGVRGCVVDGLIRDVNYLMALGFQSWCRGHTPRDIVGYWLPVRTGGPITIGAVTIRAGDFLVGDRDGMVRVPIERAEAVADAAQAAMAKESLVRRAILDGVDPQQAYITYGKF